MIGQVVEINTKPVKGAVARPVSKAQLAAAIGLEGDRYAGIDGGVVSLIEAEEVARFNRTTGLEITAAQTGRNITTRGVRLNDLEGKRFSMGSAVLECFELCEPCRTLGKRLSNDRVDAAAVVKAFTHSAGIRARVITGGAIAPGTVIAGPLPDSR